ncbi:uncharacterized protein [Leptinotarsa decemlineata]|uniref:uncharacterized protein n=1 Tax=Leptinotarsa decemlineata TaxID=7539 RepID=UPI003D304E05
MAQSDNLPKIDVFMMTSFFANHPDFTSAEMRGIKAARSQIYSYGDSAIGYVQVNRKANICVVKARITPEHNVKQKCYSVTAVCDEAEQRIVSAECEDCAAHSGGCKHAIAFIAWLHRRSEDLSSTSIDCYWKKSKLSTIGTTLKYIRAKELSSSSKAKPAPFANTRSLLPTLINHSKSIGHMESQLMKYYKKKSRVEK